MNAVEAQLRWLLRPFQHWLDDPSVTDVYINGPDRFFVKRAGRTTRQDVRLSLDDLTDIGINAAALMARDIGPDVPLCSTRFPDGHRVQLIRPPAVADDRYSISIRRPAAQSPTLDDLAVADAGVFSQARLAGTGPSEVDRELMALYRAGNWRAFLHLGVSSGKNLVFAGEVGSGKTHNLRAFTNSIRREARIVTVEDMPEIIGLPHENVVNMFYSEGRQGTARVSAEDLIVAALRMGMDYLLMQELRNAAAFAYLRALASGHPGMTTCHAPSASAAFDAIRLMVKQHEAGRHLAEGDVRAMLFSLIDIVVHCECRDGRYRMTEVWYDPEHRGGIAPPAMAAA